MESKERQVWSLAQLRWAAERKNLHTLDQNTRPILYEYSVGDYRYCVGDLF
jgi:hypothetical protein